jgi:hypothetical protein
LIEHSAAIPDAVSKGEHMGKHLVVVAVGIFLALALAIMTYAADPFIGTWSRNVAKSDANDASMSPKREILKIEIQGDIYTWTWEGVDAQYHYDWSGKNDGKDYPVTGNPYVGMASAKKTGNNTLLLMQKMAGKKVGKWRIRVSKDGKTLTATGEGKNLKGREYTATSVYDKQ